MIAAVSSQSLDANALRACASGKPMSQTLRTTSSFPPGSRTCSHGAIGKRVSLILQISHAYGQPWMRWRHHWDLRKLRGYCYHRKLNWGHTGTVATATTKMLAVGQSRNLLMQTNALPIVLPYEPVPDQPTIYKRPQERGTPTKARAVEMWLLFPREKWDVRSFGLAPHHREFFRVAKTLRPCSC